MPPPRPAWMPKASLPACAAPSMVTGSPLSGDGLSGASSIGLSAGAGSGSDTSGTTLSGVGSGSFSGSGGGGGGGGNISIGVAATSRLVAAVSDSRYQTSAASAPASSTPPATPPQRCHHSTAPEGAGCAIPFMSSRFTLRSSCRLAGHQTHLVQVYAAQQVQHFDHLGVLHGGIAAHDHGEVRRERFFRAQPLFQFRQGDRVGIQENLAGVVDGDGLGLRFFQRHGRTGLGQVDLDARNAGVAGQDEDHQHHQQHVDEGRDVDAAATLAGGKLGGGGHGYVPLTPVAARDASGVRRPALQPGAWQIHRRRQPYRRRWRPNARTASCSRTARESPRPGPQPYTATLPPSPAPPS